MLCSIEGLGTGEAGERLRISPVLAKLRLHQARRALPGILQSRFVLST